MIDQLDNTYEQLKTLRDNANTEEAFEKIRSQMDKINEQRRVIIKASINEATEEYKSATLALEKAQPVIKSAIDDINKIADVIEKVASVITKIEKVLI